MADQAPPENGPKKQPSPGRAGLALPDPFPDYLQCPHCGELEVEVWCYQRRARCHACGGWIDHELAACRGSSAVCRPLAEAEDAELGPA